MLLQYLNKSVVEFITFVEIPFPNFGNGNETFLFPGITGNGNGNGIVELSEHFLDTTYIIFHCNRPQM